MPPKIQANPGSGWLTAAGWMSVAAALLHIGCIMGGPDWYRFFGAGEQMARAAEQGQWMPTIITLIIAAVISGWAAFAFSAAGKIWRLPLIRTALIAVSAVLLARAALGFVPSLWSADQWPGFAFWSSAICCVLGVCFANGLRRAWPTLSHRG
jgi:hypothetical protein